MTLCSRLNAISVAVVVVAPVFPVVITPSVVTDGGGGGVSALSSEIVPADAENVNARASARMAQSCRRFFMVFSCLDCCELDGS